MTTAQNLKTYSNVVSLDQAKIFGGIGSILTILGLFPVIGTVIVVIGWILILYALKQLSDASRDSSIFNYGVIGAVLSIVASAGLFFVGASIIGFIASASTIFTPGAVISGLLLLWVNAIVSATFLYMAFNRTSLKFNVGLFNVGGLIYLIGEALTIVLVGFLIALVGQIIFAIAFFSLPERPLSGPEEGTSLSALQAERSSPVQQQTTTTTSSSNQILQQRNFCAKCGVKLEPGENYCPKCGASNAK